MEILNRKAHFNYFILEEIESGIGIGKCNSGIVGTQIRKWHI